VKIAIGYHIQDGPWGGGNQFARSLEDALKERGDEVRSTLEDDDIDVIVLTDPRGRSPQVSFDAGTIIRYLLLKNSRAIVVHRINECDERKGTKRMNALLKRANYAADYTVFIASWLKNLDVWRRETPFSVILNGANPDIYNSTGYIPWNGEQPLKLVTHHWGGNRLKGFDVYEKIDEMLSEPEWKDKIEFTYIGNIPIDARLEHTKHVPPLSGKELASEIRSHHVYVTGSVNEPAGMHHIEGALAGLPLLYRKSGALPEYCEGFGIGFKDSIEFEKALLKMTTDYSTYLKKMPEYGNTSGKMCDQYIALLEQLIRNREEIVEKRNIWRQPWQVIRNQIAI